MSYSFSWDCTLPINNIQDILSINIIPETKNYNEGNYLSLRGKIAVDGEYVSMEQTRHPFTEDIPLDIILPNNGKSKDIRAEVTNFDYEVKNGKVLFLKVDLVLKGYEFSQPTGQAPEVAGMQVQQYDDFDSWNQAPGMAAAQVQLAPMGGNQNAAFNQAPGSDSHYDPFEETMVEYTPSLEEATEEVAMETGNATSNFASWQNAMQGQANMQPTTNNPGSNFMPWQAAAAGENFNATSGQSSDFSSWQGAKQGFEADDDEGIDEDDDTSWTQTGNNDESWTQSGNDGDSFESYAAYLGRKEHQYVAQKQMQPAAPVQAQQEVQAPVQPAMQAQAPVQQSAPVQMPVQPSTPVQMPMQQPIQFQAEQEVVEESPVKPWQSAPVQIAPAQNEEAVFPWEIKPTKVEAVGNVMETTETMEPVQSEVDVECEPAAEFNIINETIHPVLEETAEMEMEPSATGEMMTEDCGCEDDSENYYYEQEAPSGAYNQNSMSSNFAELTPDTDMEEISVEAFATVSTQQMGDGIKFHKNMGQQPKMMPTQNAMGGQPSSSGMPTQNAMGGQPSSSGMPMQNAMGGQTSSNGMPMQNAMGGQPAGSSASMSNSGASGQASFSSVLGEKQWNQNAGSWGDDAQGTTQWNQGADTWGNDAQEAAHWNQGAGSWGNNAQGTAQWNPNSQDWGNASQEADQWNQNNQAGASQWGQNSMSGTSTVADNMANSQYSSVLGEKQWNQNAQSWGQSTMFANDADNGATSIATVQEIAAPMASQTTSEAMQPAPSQIVAEEPTEIEVEEVFPFVSNKAVPTTTAQAAAQAAEAQPKSSIFSMLNNLDDEYGIEDDELPAHPMDSIVTQAPSQTQEVLVENDDDGTGSFGSHYGNQVLSYYNKKLSASKKAAAEAAEAATVESERPQTASYFDSSVAKQFSDGASFIKVIFVTEDRTIESFCAEHDITEANIYNLENLESLLRAGDRVMVNYGRRQ